MLSISDLPRINISSHNPASVSVHSSPTGMFSLRPRISFNALSALFPFTCFSFSSCLTISVAHASITSHAGAIWCRMTRTKHNGRVCIQTFHTFQQKYTADSNSSAWHYALNRLTESRWLQPSTLALSGLALATKKAKSQSRSRKSRRHVRCATFAATVSTALVLVHRDRGDLYAR